MSAKAIPVGKHLCCTNIVRKKSAEPAVAATDIRMAEDKKYPEGKTMQV